MTSGYLNVSMVVVSARICHVTVIGGDAINTAQDDFDPAIGGEGFPFQMPQPAGGFWKAHTVAHSSIVRASHEWPIRIDS